MTNTKYTDDAYQLLKNVGGRDNIRYVKHCVTRMRFFLKDPAMIDPAEIDELDSVTGSFTQGGQYQVVIGEDVPEFYNEFMQISGANDSYSEDDTEQKSLKKIASKVKELIFN